MSAISSMFKRKKSPDQIVTLLAKDLRDIASRGGADTKTSEDVAKRVKQMREVIYGEPDKEDPVDPEGVVSLATALQREEVMVLSLAHFKAVDFESRKGIASVFVYLLRHDTASITSYMEHHAALLYQMMDGYSAPDLALHCGMMVRECIKIPSLHASLLEGPDGGLSKPLHELMTTYVNDPNFEVSADAFDTLTAILTTHKPQVFAWLNPDGGAASLARYCEFFELYNRLLASDNYVLKRLSLKLLSEFLLDRENFRIMMRYISDRTNLRLIMMMLRHKQPNIQFEAFHVFKVFVANPEKPDDIAEVLAANKAKLVPFLRSFQNEKEDEQFAEEKAMLVDTILRLPDVELPQPHYAPSAGGGEGVYDVDHDGAH